MADIKRDFRYGLALGNLVKLSDYHEVFQWVQLKLSELKLVAESVNVLSNKVLPRAFGELGEPSGIEEFIYMCKRLAETY
jgi:hypothetical protein